MVVGATLYDLVSSSNSAQSLHGYAGQYGMTKAMSKEFGDIYYNDKVVYYDPRNHILEIRMFMGTATEKAYKGYHAVRMAIYNVHGKVYNSLEELYDDQIGDKLMLRNLMKDPTADEYDAIGKDRAEHIAIMKDAVKGDSTTWKARGFKAAPDLDSNRIDIDYLHELNNRLTGAIIPVASRDPKDFGHLFGHSGQFFYLEDNYIDYSSYVRVSCSCSSYYYRFGWYNFYKGAHLGQKPNPYIKSGKNKDINVQNVHGDMGMCKHLLMFTMLLMNGGIVNRLGVQDFTKNRDAILNREERLNIPKMLATKREMEKIYRKMTRELKVDRNEYESLRGYNDWKKKQQALNKANGIQYNKGVSKAAYYNQIASSMGKVVVNENSRNKDETRAKRTETFDNIVKGMLNQQKQLNSYYKNRAADAREYMDTLLYDSYGGNAQKMIAAFGGRDKFQKHVEDKVKSMYNIFDLKRHVRKRRNR